ncbi:hypothetical protein ACA910_019123 [Epithemia clementina (nom. ined.)]
MSLQLVEHGNHEYHIGQRFWKLIQTAMIESSSVDASSLSQKSPKTLTTQGEIASINRMLAPEEIMPRIHQYSHEEQQREPGDGGDVELDNDVNTCGGQHHDEDYQRKGFWDSGIIIQFHRKNIDDLKSEEEQEDCDSSVISELTNPMCFANMKSLQASPSGVKISFDVPDCIEASDCSSEEMDFSDTKNSSRSSSSGSIKKEKKRRRWNFRF